MDKKVLVTLSKMDIPFVIRGECLSSWPCMSWSLNDWSEKCGPTKFPFRIHKKNSHCFWENEAVDRFETSLSNFLEWRRFDSIDCSSENPFAKYPKTDYWAYSSYNYMNQLFSDDKQKEIIDSVKWSEIGLDSNLDTNGKNSTLWIGTEGAFTPCHQDTYGYNFVAQITGKYVILR